MEDFKFTTCTECFRPEVCTSRCECNIIAHSTEDVAQLRGEEEDFITWVTDHATNRDINRDGGAL